MTDADRSRWMFIAIAVLTLCGGGAYTAHADRLEHKLKVRDDKNIE